MGNSEGEGWERGGLLQKGVGCWDRSLGGGVTRVKLGSKNNDRGAGKPHTAPLTVRLLR